MLTQLASSNWKERLAACEEFQKVTFHMNFSLYVLTVCVWYLFVAVGGDGASQYTITALCEGAGA